MPSTVSNIDLRQLACEANGGHVPSYLHSSYEYICTRCNSSVIVPRLQQMHFDSFAAKRNGDDRLDSLIRHEMYKLWDMILDERYVGELQKYGPYSY